MMILAIFTGPDGARINNGLFCFAHLPKLFAPILGKCRGCSSLQPCTPGAKTSKCN